MRYRRVFDSERIRFVDALVRTFSSCDRMLLPLQLARPRQHQVAISFGRSQIRVPK